MKGDGTARRSYFYASDLAIGLWTILLRGKSCWPYNLGSDEPISIRDVAKRVAAAFTPVRQVQVALQPLPGAPAVAYVPNVVRLRTELGVQQTVALDDAVRKTASWHRRVSGTGAPGAGVHAVA